MALDTGYDKQSKLHTVGVGVLFAASLLWLVTTIPLFLLWAFVIAADAYACFLLILAALRKPKLIPNRFPALVIVPVLFLTLVSAFAGIYIESETITWQKTEIGADGKVTGKNQRIDQPKEALYASLETITTYGATALPASSPANLTVVIELLSGALLLLMILPILVARLAGFEGSVVREQVFVEKQEGKDWKIIRVQTTENSISNTANNTKMQIDTANGKVALQVPSEGQ
jgi:hypothetical protein